jgi:hypothetical protein
LNLIFALEIYVLIKYMVYDYHKLLAIIPRTRIFGHERFHTAKTSFIMFKAAVERLAAILRSNYWVLELAGILPLSALVDFHQHTTEAPYFELASAVLL